MLLALQACSGDKSKMLTKTWRIENLRYLQDVPPELKPQVDGWVGKMKDAFTLTYYQDGTYETNLLDQKMKGTWKLDWTGKHISSVGADGKQVEYKIQKLTDTEYIFEMNIEKQVVIFEMVPAQKQDK